MTKKNKDNFRRENKFFLASTFIIPINEFLSNEKYAKYWQRKRWLIFRDKGLKCSYCDLVGVEAIVWQDHPKDNAISHEVPWDAHVDLAAYNEKGERIMMTLDHVIPKSKGGSNQHWNLIPACNPCNHTKANKLPPTFFL
jgi:5-methylcytosine-specific restriction endonuclease McrA